MRHSFINLQRSAEMDAVKAATARITGLVPSIKTFVGGLQQRISDLVAAQDLPGLQALADELGSDADNIVASITENTPAAKKA
jgi:hypothetical protein